MGKLNEILGIIVAILFFFLILFLQPTLVDAKDFKYDMTNYKKDTKCNGKGYIDSSTGLCVCQSPWRGGNCTLKYCPFGESWIDFPREDHIRYRPLAECSNMGNCDMQTGKCTCRDGFSGRGCERTSCPSKSTNSTCSGHGRCLSMRDAASSFDGLTLTSPSIAYTLWDADAIMGCVCDKGYEGYDCSFRSCPKGVDPTSTSIVADEKFTIHCRAQSGSFVIQAFGYVTPPVPHNAGPGVIKYLLESLPGVGSVDVEMDITTLDIRAGYSLQPFVCGDGHGDFATTNIYFNDHHGSLPLIRVLNNHTATTHLSNGTNPTLTDDIAPILRLVTSYSLTCSRCATCGGSIYFGFGDSVTAAIDISTTDISNIIETYISQLDDLVDAEYTNLVVNVSTTRGVTSICDSVQDSEIIINLLSDYGNLPSLKLFDGSYTSSTVDVPRNITLTSLNKGTGLMYECSNQGFCDYNTGKCICNQQIESNNIIYQATGSDGNQALGGKGDCGYLAYTSNICSKVAEPRCHGHGFCFAANDPACTCYDGWYGADCQVAMCPKGQAWFDEAISANEAHQLVECSNMGKCNRKNGVCVCKKGYSGNACQYYDCPRDEITGVPCSGKGWCMNMNKWSDHKGISYGDESNIRLYPQAWDAFKIYNCMCSARTIDGFTGNIKYPTVGPIKVISGYPGKSKNLMGWRGWNCGERNCPVGDTVGSTPNCKSESLFEKQRILCTRLDDAADFVLRFDGFASLPISSNMTANQVKLALEYMPSIGNISAVFPNEQVDSISSVCHPDIDVTLGGLVITFLTELSDDLPLLKSYTNDINVTIAVKGTKSIAECNGEDHGMCNRVTGQCMCYGNFASSNGANEPGNRGDCGYYVPFKIN